MRCYATVKAFASTCASLFLLGACSTSSPTDVPDSSTDAPLADAGHADGAGSDGPTADAPIPDGSTSDASSLSDTSTSDASSTSDTSMSDAASAETIAPHDGGSETAGAGALLHRSAGGRSYDLYVPASVTTTTTAPLVVMLHGCDEQPADFEQGTAMDALADAHGFLVAYPQQPSSANALECWNWFLPADQARGSGEPSSIAGVVADVKGSYAVDAKATFVAGMSSGGAMAVILGATYPDLFAAIAVHSGLEYAAATDETSALNAQASGGPAPKGQGDAAFTAMGSFARVVPAIVFHGDADTEVNIANATQVIDQWVETDARASGDAISTTATTTVDGAGPGKTFTHTTYADPKSGATLLELYVVHGMNHAWSGGVSGAPYTDPQGPDASTLLWSFFDAHRRS